MSDEPPLRPNQLSIQRLPGSSSCRLERPEREIYCSCPPIADVNDLSYTSASPCADTHLFYFSYFKTSSFKTGSTLWWVLVNTNFFFGTMRLCKSLWDFILSVR